MKSQRISMPKWPAYVMGAFALACAYPAVTMPRPSTPTVAAETVVDPAPLLASPTVKPHIKAGGTVTLAAR
jgi:hypothetical protein